MEFHKFMIKQKNNKCLMKCHNTYMIMDISIITSSESCEKEILFKNMFIKFTVRIMCFYLTLQGIKLRSLFPWSGLFLDCWAILRSICYFGKFSCSLLFDVNSVKLILTMDFYWFFTFMGLNVESLGLNIFLVLWI